MTTVFDVIRKLAATGALEQAAAEVDNLIKGETDRLDQDVRDSGTKLVNQGKLLAELPVETSLAARGDYLTQLLDYLTALEAASESLPLPPVVPYAATPPDPEEEVVDRREAALIENPIRRLAWLRRGLCVARAVCQVENTRAKGTGFLLQNGRIVTNNHVIESEKEAGETCVRFNYQEDLQGEPPRSFVTYKLRADDFITSRSLDCTIVGVASQPAGLRRWKTLEIATEDGLQAFASVSIIQHPGGSFKRIALSGSVVTSINKPPYIYYETSTMKGSSGAPVLNDDWKVVALHRAAGRWWEPRKRYINNEGVRISAILQDRELGRFLK